MMRVLEVVVILVIFVFTAGILFGKMERRLNAVLFMSLVLVVLLHGIIDHFRIQMVPAYAAVLMLIIVLLLRLAKLQSKDPIHRLKLNFLMGALFFMKQHLSFHLRKSYTRTERSFRTLDD
ncbi:hypothetical protein AB4Z45_11445 [Paenibacillus sp. MCAF9]|uniref:hypothetical protein n=1 Tax=Paenibacillus sp. MCAF9 TaxID=3233046 RepID=UPI003F954F57